MPLPASTLEFEQLASRVAEGHLSGVRVVPRAHGNRTFRCAVTGTMSVCGTDWDIELRLPREFPSKLPKIYVKRELAGSEGHVGGDGELCVLQQEGVAGDYRRPEALIDEVLQRARRTLGDLAAGPQAASVLNELEAYCTATSSAKVVRSYFDPGSEVLTLRAGWERGSFTFFTRDDTELDAFFGAPVKRSTQRRAVYVPLTDSASSSLTLPLPFAQSGTTARDFITRHCADRRGLRKAFKKGHTLLVLGFPRDGQRALAAVDFGSNTPNKSDAVALLAVQRADRAALAPRGGADARLGEKIVMVVGCGAVGGYVAHQLAKAGAGKLVLVDDDTMRNENLFRHVLGTDALGERKASALARAVQRAAPYCEAQTHVMRVERLLEDKPRVFEEIDLVILATGDPGVDLRVSDTLRRGLNPPLVATWVEPLGLGGHVFAAASGSACLRCLYDETERGLTNRSSFAAPHQDYAVTDAGCGGAHTPFSNSDAVRTADLTVQSSVALLNDAKQEALLRSWKGDPTAFYAAGYSTTPRFESLAMAVRPEPCAPCSTCGRSAA